MDVLIPEDSVFHAYLYTRLQLFGLDSGWRQVVRKPKEKGGFAPDREGKSIYSFERERERETEGVRDGLGLGIKEDKRNTLCEGSKIRERGEQRNQRMVTEWGLYGNPLSFVEQEGRTGPLNFT